VSVHTDARYYEPTSGRFLSADPMGQAASPSLYDFCGGDPVNFFDPDGRCPNTGNRYPNGLYKPTEVNIANGVNDPGVGGQNPVDPNPGVYNGVATAALDGGTRFLNQLFSDIINTPQSIADAAGSAAAGLVNLVDSGTRAQTASGIVQDIKSLGSLQTWENLGSSLLTPEGLANSVYSIEMGIAGSALGTASSGTVAAETVANPISGTLARVIPNGINATTLGAPGAADVFVTNAAELEGLNAQQIAAKLTIPESPTGFQIIQFSTPESGLASPVFRTNPGFIQGGQSAGGASEFVIPNGPIPTGSTITVVH